MDKPVHPSRICRICLTAPLQFLFDATDTNRNIDERAYSVLACPLCQVAQTFPVLSAREVERYYTREYYAIDESIALEASRQSMRERAARIRRIRRYLKSGRLLDVGAGMGLFLKTARESGFEVQGLELSREAARLGKKLWDLDIAHGDLLTAALPGSHFDVVTLSHVFEHIDDPVTAARLLHETTRKGGLLVIGVPNFASAQARLFRERWFHLDVPRHRFHYTPQSLSSILRTTGFSIVEVNYLSEHNWAGILGSIMRLSPPGESLIHKSVRKILGVPLARGAAYLEGLLQRGGTFDLFAVKL